MRVSSQRFNVSNRAPYAIPFSWFNTHTDEEGGEGIPFESTLSNEMVPPQQSSNVSETFSDSVWKHILPGLERGCIILRSQDYSHTEIAWILGMKTDEVSRILYKVKNRLVKMGITQNSNTTRI